MMRSWVVIWGVIFFSVMEIFIIFGYINQKKTGRLIENIIVSVIAVLFVLFKRSLGIQIHDSITVLWLLTILGHTFIGEYFTVYRKSKTYDRYLHLVGSFVFSYFIYSILSSLIKPSPGSKIYVGILIATIGITAGVVFELAEFIYDTVGKKGKYNKSQHGLADTDYDMIYNVIGSVVAAIFSPVIF
jgi:hypothetical protein